MKLPNYQNLSQTFVSQVDLSQAEQVLFSLLAERATVTGEGKILRFSEFNENPDLLVNELLARIIIGKMDKSAFAELSWDQVVVVSIESSAAYLAGSIAHEVKRVFGLTRPPCIIRARKLPAHEQPSPALGDNRIFEPVTPITAGGETRYLVASMPDGVIIPKVILAIVVDDFRATGSTLSGGIALTRKLIDPTVIVPVAAFGKPEQESRAIPHITGLDVNFWKDVEHKRTMIQINGGDPTELKRMGESV